MKGHKIKAPDAATMWNDLSEVECL